MNGILSVQERLLVRLHVLAALLLYPFGWLFRLILGIGIAVVFVCSLPWALFSRKRRAQEYVLKAKGYERRSEVSQAEEQYLLALQHNPKCGDAHLGLCRCYLAQVKLAEARVHGEAFLRKNPMHAEGNLYMAAVLHYQGHSGAALKLLGRAEQLYPEKYKHKARALISKIKKKMKYEGGMNA